MSRLHPIDRQRGRPGGVMLTRTGRARTKKAKEKKKDRGLRVAGRAGAGGTVMVPECVPAQFKYLCVSWIDLEAACWLGAK